MYYAKESYKVKQKICSICGEKGHSKFTHGMTELQRFIYESEKRLSRKKSVCSVCGETGHSRRWHENQEKISYLTEKLCSTCKQLLPVERFDKHDMTQVPGGPIFTKYYSECKDCHRSAAKLRSIENHDENLDKTRLSYMNLCNKIHYMFGRIKDHCKERDIIFDIDEEYIKYLYYKQDGKCAYSGLSMTANTAKRRDCNGKLNIYDKLAMSVDRKDSSLGYTRDNVVLTCWVINNAKNQLSEEDFYDMCRIVAKKHPKAKIDTSDDKKQIECIQSSLIFDAE